MILMQTFVFVGTATCQAGVVLEQLENALSDHRLMVPLDLGAKGRYLSENNCENHFIRFLIQYYN